jgi:hypothetical protein
VPKVIAVTLWTGKRFLFDLLIRGLPLTMFAALFIPANLFLYGWSAQCHLHWAVLML